MDFGGFLVFGFLVVVLVALACLTFQLVLARSPQRRGAVRLLGVMCVVVGLAGRYLYQIYWLDEGLWAAARHGDVFRVRALLADGASTNYQWEDGSTALSQAQRYGYADVATILIRAGAKR